MRSSRSWLVWVVLFGTLWSYVGFAAAQPPAGGAANQPVPDAPVVSRLRVVLDTATFTEPYSGRVYVVIAPQGSPRPMTMMGDWFGPVQVVARDVTNIPPGGEVEFWIAVDTLGYPLAFADLREGPYAIQAVARRALDSPNPGRGPGDAYSKPIAIDLRPKPNASGGESAAELRLTEVVAERPFPETDRVKLVEIVSPSLSAFHGREVKIRAGVVLPKDMTAAPAHDAAPTDAAAQPVRRPTLYFITGFGGDHRSARGMARFIPDDGTADNVLLVVPDPTCYRGHSVFADSANNGPWGRALMDELVPEVERRFGGAGPGPEGNAKRYVTGISSGGWSSLWLAITYPDRFAGCWSHCPDPVSFHDFQRIDLYRDGSNMYQDEQGAKRPLARQGDRVILWYENFVKQEIVMGPGGQIHAFEAVFSPRGKDGEPVPLFDRQTGMVDIRTARAWEAYDIEKVIERGWADLGPRLQGKLFVYAGELDTFYLEGAVVRLRATLERLGSDAHIEVVPGMDHSIHQPGVAAMFERIARDHAR